MVYIFALLILCCNGVFLNARERITSFATHIRINSDATLTIQEKIQIFSEHTNIRYGIVREFPTKYHNAWAGYYVVDYTIQSITHNGYPAEYSIEKTIDGENIYIGNKDTLVPRGENLYTITYTTHRQVTFLDTHDEIYLNAIGTKWYFPIDKAEVYIELPENISATSINALAYTGYQGEQGNNYSSRVSNNCIIFSNNQILQPYQGMTVLVTLDKGYITEPTWYQQIYWFFRDNLLLLLLCIALFALTITIYRGIMKARHINISENIQPTVQQHVDMTPSEVGYINAMQFSNTLLIADIINLAAQNLITITYDVPNKFHDGMYKLTLTNPIESLQIHKAMDRYTKSLLAALFSKEKTIAITKAHSSEIQSALRECKKHIERYDTLYITTLTHYLYTAMLLSFAISYGILLFLQNQTITNPLPNMFLSFAIITILYFFFKKLFRVYTFAGRKKQDTIEGFKTYLANVDLKRILILDKETSKIAELYDTHVPYAVALGMEEQFTMQFLPFLEIITQEKKYHYRLWYHRYHFRTYNFISKLTEAFAHTLTTESNKFGKIPSSLGKKNSGGGWGGGGGRGW